MNYKLNFKEDADGEAICEICSPHVAGEAYHRVSHFLFTCADGENEKFHPTRAGLMAMNLRETSNGIEWAVLMDGKKKMMRRIGGE